MSVHTALAHLAHHARASQDVFENGARILEKQGVHRLGDEGAFVPCTRAHLTLTFTLTSRVGIFGTARACGDRCRTARRCGRTYVSPWRVGAVGLTHTPAMPADAR